MSATDPRCNCPPLIDVMRGHVIGTKPPCPVHPEPTYPPGTFKPRIEGGHVTKFAFAQADAMFDPEREIDRLHAEIATLTEECRSRAAWAEQYMRERDEAIAERDAAREALREIHDAAVRHDYDRISGMASSAINLYGEHLRAVLTEGQETR